jgi:hypothetical protein
VLFGEAADAELIAEIPPNVTGVTAMGYHPLILSHSFPVANKNMHPLTLSLFALSTFSA